jgi:hypothetical protein
MAALCRFLEYSFEYGYDEGTDGGGAYYYKQTPLMSDVR